MSQNTIIKKCFKCGVEKPLSEFYKHKAMADGHLNKCKECTKIYTNKHRIDNIEKVRKYDRNRPNAKERVAKNSERIRRLKAENNEHYIKTISVPKQKWNKENRYKKNAHLKVKRNITMKDNKPCQCQLCGCNDNNLEGHHYDYSKPLDVTWLCKRCHSLAHKAINEDKRQVS